MNKTPKNLSPKDPSEEEKKIEQLAKSEGLTRAAARARLAHEALPPHVRNPPPAATRKEATGEDAERAEPVTPRSSAPSAVNS